MNSSEPPERHWLDEQHVLEPLEDDGMPVMLGRGLVRDVRGRLWRVRRRSPDWVSAAVLLLIIVILAALVCAGA